MQYVWLVVIALSLIPATVAGFMLNPLVFLMLGPEAWRNRLSHLYPYRWRLAFSLAVFGIAISVYTVKYG